MGRRTSAGVTTTATARDDRTPNAATRQRSWLSRQSNSSVVITAEAKFTGRPLARHGSRTSRDAIGHSVRLTPPLVAGRVPYGAQASGDICASSSNHWPEIGQDQDIPSPLRGLATQPRTPILAGSLYCGRHRRPIRGPLPSSVTIGVPAAHMGSRARKHSRCGRYRRGSCLDEDPPGSARST
jgi:hypothetical protein